MLSIAGQTAGTIGLNFFVDTYGWPRGVIKKIDFFKMFLKKIPRATPGPSASLYFFQEIQPCMGELKFDIKRQVFQIF